MTVSLLPVTGDLFQAFNNVETFTAALIDRIPSMPDDDVLHTRERASEMGKASWRIVAACDAEITCRTQARRGRGNVDTEGVGVMAEVTRIAAASGVSPSTILKNAQIHNTFFADENTRRAASILDDKQFYKEALLAPDPVAAIEIMAAKKAENPFYSTRDARDDVRAMQPVAPAIPLPAGRFSVFYADPPWQYDFAETDSRQIENKYPTMPVSDICSLPILPMANDDAVLYMWATSPKMREAIAVMAAWGFEYKTSMVWVKDKIGMGYWARQRHEWLLIGTLGDFAPPAQNVRPDSVIEAPRAAHSEKPAEVAELLERLYPALPKVELFCRSPRPGWAVWGNEV